MHTLEEEVKGESSKIKKQVAQIRAFLSTLVHIALEHKEFAVVNTKARRCFLLNNSSVFQCQFKFVNASLRNYKAHELSGGLQKAFYVTNLEEV